jgi:hypothetical protein
VLVVGKKGGTSMRVRLLTLVGIFVAASVFGQEVSQKRDIAVFSLSYARWGVPQGALTLVDDEIKDVFINLGRFNVLGMSYRLEAEGIEEFIAKIREVKERDVELPETVRLGQQAFTEADFDRLVGSFIVVIPGVSFYESGRTDSGGFTAELKVTFTFVNVEKADAIGYFDIETTGSGESLQQAVKDAAEGIPAELQFELRKIPEFQLKTGIIDVNRGNVLLEFGTNMGVARGDEYLITETRILATGHAVSDEVGLLIVKDVEEEISFAKVIYSSRRPQIGDQLEEIPRLGFDTAAYAHVIVDPAGDGVYGAIGVRQSTSRGFFNFRPFVGIEIPFGVTGLLGTDGLTVNLYGGGELNWYLWRLQFVPAAAIGIAGAIPLGDDEESFSVSHVGGLVQISASYLVSKDFKVGIDLGYAAWFAPGAALSYTGLLAGAGVTLKY